MMNEYQKDLFDKLEALVKTTEAFYRQEFELDGEKYWIYNYRLASYSDFLLPGAMEARGIMFRVTDEVELVSMPMPKFFNFGENPLTMDLNLSQIETIQLKADGSLISTYLHNGKLRLKTKGSLFSDQAKDALDWINSLNTARLHGLHFLYDFLDGAAFNGITVNLEWTAPNNRIVIGYTEPRLTILNCRRMSDGTYVNPTDFADSYWDDPRLTQALMEYLIDEVKPEDPAAFVTNVPDMTEDIEGYVVKLKNGLWFKCKTSKYVSLHHAKDSVNNPRRLFEAVLDEGVDDLRSMFASDALAMQIIADMQEKVSKLYNHMVALVDKFWIENKELSRKDYAIKAQAEVERLYFGLVMKKYTGDEIDYKGFLKSKWKDLGFKDSSVSVE